MVRMAKRALVCWTLCWLALTPAQAKTVEQNLRWEQLPQSLTGQEVQVSLLPKGRVSGTLLRIEPAALIVNRRGKEESLNAAGITVIKATKRKRAKWSIIGAAIGAGAATPLLVIATIIQRTEGGVNGSKVIGATAAIVGVAGFVGFLAGASADVDRTVIHVVH